MIQQNILGGGCTALAQSCSNFKHSSSHIRRRSGSPQGWDLGGASGADGSVKPAQLLRDHSDDRQQERPPTPSMRPFSGHH